MEKKSETLLNDFLIYIRDIRGYSEMSVITYETALRQMFDLSEFFEEKEEWTLDITPLRIDITNNSKKTIAKKLSAIHSFVLYLKEQREIPVRLIGDESVKVPQTLPKPIDEKYIEEAMESAGIREKLLIMMLYGLGLRISELSSLKLDCIHKEWVEIRGKGDKVRQLPLLPAVHSLIKEYLARYTPKDYLFEKGGVNMNQAQLRYLLTKLFKSKGLKVTPHQLRHSFASHLLDHGARISDVSELLGHRSMASTQIYTKLGDSKKLNEYLNAHPLAGKK